DGKQLRFRPCAVAWKPRDGKGRGILTVTGDEATVDFDQPWGTNKAGAAMKVVHARIAGNVQLRDDRGTPDDPGDDLVVGPLSHVEYDEASLQIRSETKVELRDRGVRITGFDLRVRLRASEVAEGFDGVGS